MKLVFIIEAISRMHFTFRQLEAFAAASELQNFTLTAAHLHLTPSAVSQLVVELESSLGYKLFDRHTRRVVLSQAGRAFLPAAKAILREVAAAKSAAADIRDQATGVVRIAASLAVACAILPEIIARYRALHPKVQVRVIDCAADGLVNCVASRHADLALGPDQPVDADVERVALFPSPWVAWCVPRHRFMRKRTLSWHDLHTEEFVAAGRDHEIHLAHVLRMLPAAKRFAPVHVVDNITTALGLAAAGVCYTLSPDYVSPLALPLGLEMREIGGPVAAREVSLFRRADRALSPVAEGLGNLAMELLHRDTPNGR